jgi:hypothetical protein
VVFAQGIRKLSAEGTALPSLLALTGEDEILWKTWTKNLNGKSVRQILAEGKDLPFNSPLAKGDATPPYCDEMYSS